MEDVRKLVKSVQEIDGGKESYLWFSSNVERADHDYMGFFFFFKKSNSIFGFNVRVTKQIHVFKFTVCLGVA